MKRERDRVIASGNNFNNSLGSIERASSMALWSNREKKWLDVLGGANPHLPGIKATPPPPQSLFPGLSGSLVVIV
eukprot:4435801-Heterocapsa_arctica.AAC.1